MSANTLALTVLVGLVICHASDASNNTVTVDKLYMYQSDKQAVKTGGMYVKGDAMCNDAAVWVCEVDGGCDPRMALYLGAEGYWVISDVTCDGVALVRSMKEYDSSDEQTAPDKTSQWLRAEGTKWVYDDEVRVTARGCHVPDACLQLNCQEPTDGYTCDECTINGSLISCGKSSPLRYIFLGVALLLILSISVLAYFSLRSQAAYATTPITTPFTTTTFTAFRTSIWHRYRTLIVSKMASLGRLISLNRKIFILAPFTCLVILIGLGLPVVKTRSAGSYSADWVPRGGRLEDEINYVQKWSDPSKTGTGVEIMVGPDDTSKSALTKHYLRELLRVYQEVYALKVPAYYNNGSSTMVGYQDWCLSIDNPMITEFPCMNPSPLDCYFEGSWAMGDVSLGHPLPVANQSDLYKANEFYAILAPGQLLTYSDRPSFMNETDEQILEQMSLYPTECQHWAPSVTKGRGYLFGGYKTSDQMTDEAVPKPKMESAVRLVGWTLQHSARRAMSFRKTLAGLDENAVDDAMNRWFDAVSDKLEEIDNDEVNYPGTSVSVFMTVSLTRMFTKIGKTGTRQVAQGLIIVTVFIILSQIRSTKRNTAVIPALIGLLLVCISIVAGFALVALCGIVFNHTILQALPFFALGIGVDDMFLLLNYLGDVPKENRATEDIISDLLRKAGISVTLTSMCNAVSALAAGLYVPIPALSHFLFATSIIIFINYLTMLLIFPAVLAWSHDSNKSSEPPFVIERFYALLACIASFFKSSPNVIKRYYMPFMAKRSVQLSVAFLNLLLFAAFVAILCTVHPLEFGFDIVDLTPRGSYLSKGFRENEDYIATQSMSHSYVVKAIDFPNRQLEMKKLHNWVKYNRWTNDTTDMRGFWMDWFDDFVQKWGLLKNASGFIPVDKPIPPTYPYVERYDQFIEPDEWYPMAMTWRNPSLAQLDMVTSITTDPFGWRWGFESFELNNTLLKTDSLYTVNMSMLKNPSDWVEHIEFMRDGMGAIVGEGNAFPDPSGPYLQMQEFMHLKKFFWVAFAIVVSVVFVCSMLLGVGLCGSLLVAYTAAASTIEVMALLMIFNIKFQSIAAVTLLLSIGVNVEFSAHVIVGYITADGCPNEKTRATIHDTFIPVLEGGASSFLMFSLLYLSPFPYVQKYFFWVLFISITVGLLHGLVFLPATMATLDRCAIFADNLRPKGVSEDYENAGTKCGTKSIDTEPEPEAAVKNPLTV
eukprot:TRINITY_DN9454_c0_g1_i1.p1 TRINITY_DN9454_c0_g1~~TRINITY_DN9454_c0_g1_i1.p1  ORF type:complete len:1243 (+),score=373.37 TRINITY_DN9454_c0_g1_i1:75-3731(+)